jgi:aminopeptidase N
MALSQENYSCSEGKILSHQKLAKKTRAGQYANSLLDKYDVHFYFLDINAERNNTIISGSTTIGAKVTATSLDTFCFELNQSLTIDSVIYNNQPLTLASSGSIRYAIFSSPQPMNTNMYVKIYYNGDAHVVGGAAIGDGFSSDVSGAWGNECTWSLSEPYSAYEWFPCKQFLQDKADSAWIFVTTSDENKVGSNGILEGIDVMPNNKVRYRWKTHYIIDYYLISVAIAKYVDYTIYAHPAALLGDSVKIMNYVYDNPLTLLTFKSQIDSNALVLDYYSEIMGLYPFHAEKYGHSMAPFGGGMEHQTMTSIGSLGSFSVNSHELFHQWWGDHVTCKTWKDIFINEGFASYGEYLAYDHFRGHQAAQNKMQSVHDNVLQDSFAMVYFTDTNNVGRIFSKRLTYDKGSAVIHTLRFVLGDSLFFKGLREFQSTFSFSTASIDDLHIVMETVSNMSLYDYFQQWLYGEGYPVYSAEYYSDGTNIYLKVTHVTSSPVTPVFKTPLEIKCLSVSGDTTIRVNINQNTNTFIIPCSKIINGLEFDPNNWLLNKEDAIVENPALVSLHVANTEMENQTLIYPNPSADEVTIENSTLRNARFTLRDLNGSVLQQGNFDHKITLQLSHLASGVYFVEVLSPQGKISRKLSKY